MKNTITKRLLPLFLACILLLSITASATYSDRYTDAFIQYLEPLYNYGLDGYTLRNVAGTNITQQFLDSTQQYYKQNDWPTIINYYSDIVAYGEYTSTIHSEHNTRATEVPKTMSKTFTNIISRVSGRPGTSADEQITVISNLSATIYYDPNTYIISNVGSPSLTITLPIPKFNQLGIFFTQNRKTWSSIASNKYSATIYASFDVRYQEQDMVGLLLDWASYQTPNPYFTIYSGE